MSVSYQGIGQVCATFLTMNAVEGQVVKMISKKMVAKCSDGNDICGVALHKRGTQCTVQVAGFVTVPYSGTAPSVGWATLCANGTGGVKTATEGGHTFLVVDVNTTDLTVTIKL